MPRINQSKSCREYKSYSWTVSELYTLLPGDRKGPSKAFPCLTCKTLFRISLCFTRFSRVTVCLFLPGSKLLYCFYVHMCIVDSLCSCHWHWKATKVLFNMTMFPEICSSFNPLSFSLTIEKTITKSEPAGRWRR